MSKTQLSVIIPTFNEESSIRNTLLSLLHQYDLDWKLIDPNLYQIIVVDNNSTDQTLPMVKDMIDAFTEHNIYITTENKQGIVPARNHGYALVNNNNELTTPYLASGDADVHFHPQWIATILKTFAQDSPDIISNAGCYPTDFWMKAPTLVEKYLRDVGTIFFNKDTIEYFNLKGKQFKFTEQIFSDFIRPVTDGCFAVTKEAYLRSGGYTEEFWDDEGTKPVHGEGWRLSFVLERINAKFVYSNSASYNSDPRRLLEEPEKFLGNTSYEDMANYRKPAQDLYVHLNQYAKEVNLLPVQHYIIDYYIILKCITRPDLILNNSQYFGTCKDSLYKEIQSWWNERKFFQGKELFVLSKQLGEKYFETIKSSMPEIIV